jgi:homocysteine S-methyltransferase
MREPFLEHLKDNLLVGDGAMGTMIYARGVPLSQSYDELNLSHPDIITSIHEEYVRAGAQTLETNSFTANRTRLARFGLENKVGEINTRSVELARRAAGDKAYVLASVGPVRDREVDDLSDDDTRQVYAEQINALIAAQPDALIFETFLRLGELELAVIEGRRLTPLPIIAQLTADEDGFTRDGQHIIAAFRKLRANGADVVGINCAKGPAGIIHAMEQVPLEPGLLLSAFPNAGLPMFNEGRYIYLSTPEYFGESARRLRDQGVRLIGGCCGTEPEHIRAMAAALRNLSPQTAKASIRPVPRPMVPQNRKLAPPPQPGFLKTVEHRPTFIVELDPPRDLQHEKVITGSAELQRAGADAITMADSSLGITRMSNMALGHLVQQQTGMLPIIHLACRDRNLIGLQSELMGLHALGLHCILALTGDPAKFGDQPEATSVYDLNSFNLVSMIKRMNQGVTFSGRTIDPPTRFIVGVAFNPNVDRISTQVSRLRRKIELGADFVMTQPIFDWKKCRDIHQALREFHVPVFVGVMPLVSGRNANFLHNEVPGIDIPERVRKRMFKFEDERARREGVTIAAEIVESLLDYFNGIYLITPFMRYEMCIELMERFHKPKAPSRKRFVVVHDSQDVL